MRPTSDRILKQRDIEVMVALDTIGYLTTRVRNLFADGRRITIATRHIDSAAPPEIIVGLTAPHGVETWVNPAASGTVAYLKRDACDYSLRHFSFAALADEGNATEADASARYHAAGIVGDDRRTMTRIRIVGGLPGDGPARDDQIIIRHWNDHGACKETVVVFDYDTGHTAARLRTEDAAAKTAYTGDRDKATDEHLTDTVNWARDNYVKLNPAGAVDGIVTDLAAQGISHGGAVVMLAAALVRLASHEEELPLDVQQALYDFFKYPLGVSAEESARWASAMRQRHSALLDRYSIQTYWPRPGEDDPAETGEGK